MGFSFEDVKYVIDQRIADVKNDKYLSDTDDGLRIILRLIDLFGFPEDEKQKALKYVKEQFNENT